MKEAGALEERGPSLSAGHLLPGGKQPRPQPLVQVIWPLQRSSSVLLRCPQGLGREASSLSLSRFVSSSQGNDLQGPEEESFAASQVNPSVPSFGLMRKKAILEPNKPRGEGASDGGGSEDAGSRRNC